MTPVVLRIGWLCVAVALTLARSCGFTPEDRKGEGEPCTRTSECELGLECRGGVCMVDAPDGGFDAAIARDASSPPDATPEDAASTDAASDAAVDASAVDASAVDASAVDASAVDAGDASPVSDGG